MVMFSICPSCHTFHTDIGNWIKLHKDGWYYNCCGDFEFADQARQAVNVTVPLDILHQVGEYNHNVVSGNNNGVLSHFHSCIFAALARADTNNTNLLRQVFPDHVTAWDLYMHDQERFLEMLEHNFI